MKAHSCRFGRPFPRVSFVKLKLVAWFLGTGIMVLGFSISPSCGDEADWRQQLTTGDEAGRAEAARLLGQSSKVESTTIEALEAAAANDESVQVRSKACHALGLLRQSPKTSIPVLINACGDRGQWENTPVYSVAGAALARYGEETIPFVRERLRGQEKPQIQAALFALDNLGPFASPLVDDLLPLLQSDDSNEIRGALNAVVKIGPPAKQSLPALRKLLSHENFHIQYWSCRAIGSLGPAGVAGGPDLAALLKTGAGSVRRNAAAALGKLGPELDKDSLDTLAGALDDPIQPVKIAAVVALGELAPATVKFQPLLEEKLKQRTFNVRAHAAMTLWRMEPGNGRAKTMLLEELQSVTAPFEAGGSDRPDRRGNEAVRRGRQGVEQFEACDHPGSRRLVAWESRRRSS